MAFNGNALNINQKELSTILNMVFSSADNALRVNLPTLTQSFTSQTSVTVTHNLGYHPIVSVTDGSGNVVIGDVQHTSNNAFNVGFVISQTGTIEYK